MKTENKKSIALTVQKVGDSNVMHFITFYRTL